ncbi:hypothetical protein G9P44_006291 [Scheffersomyces stipitis]|nr:hypothetical protein G9P44_006291 [Scheffersomyces stipitis]
MENERHRYSSSESRNGPPKDMNKKPNPNHNRRREVVARPGPRPLELSSGYLTKLKHHLAAIPHVQLLDALEQQSSPILEAYIDQYLESNKNFASHPRLQHKHQLYYLKDCMQQVFGRKSVLFSVDMEAWEINTNVITEIGISIFDPRGQMMSMLPSTNQIHILIQENYEKRNGRFVPDHSRNFVGGTSLIMTKYEAACFTQTLIDYYFQLPNAGLNCALVGHDVKGDVKWLKQLGVNFPDNIKTVDTSTLFSITQGKNGNSLKNALSAVDIPYSFLHNAGNDAYYTLLAAMKLCDPSSRSLYGLDIFTAEESRESSPLTPNSTEFEESSAPATPKPNEPQSGGRKNKRKDALLNANVATPVEIESALHAASVVFRRPHKA